MDGDGDPVGEPVAAPRRHEVRREAHPLVGRHGELVDGVVEFLSGVMPEALAGLQLKDTQTGALSRIDAQSHRNSAEGVPLPRPIRSSAA